MFQLKKGAIFINKKKIYFWLIHNTAGFVCFRYSAFLGFLYIISIGLQNKMILYCSVISIGHPEISLIFIFLSYLTLDLNILLMHKEILHALKSTIAGIFLFVFIMEEEEFNYCLLHLVLIVAIFFITSVVFLFSFHYPEFAK